MSFEKINYSTPRFEKLMVNSAGGYKVVYLILFLVVFPKNELVTMLSFGETVTLIVIDGIT